MTVKVAINGFGRIGRLVLRALAESNRKDIQVIAINDLGSVETNAHMFRYDSVHGPFPGTVTTTPQTINVGMGDIHVLSEPNPEKLPWHDHQIDIVFECSGRFTTREGAEKHIKAGAKKVLISAPAEGVDLTVVYGVNHHKLEPHHQIVSNASCTTNCLAPVVHIIQENMGMVHGYMSTIHSYTADQMLVDGLHKDLRRARAGALSMIPTSTGAAKAVGLVIPELAGKLDGTAIRVPTPNVSLIDFKFIAKTSTTAEAINHAMAQAAKGSLKGILGICDGPLVSCDFNHNPHSSVFDVTQTQVIGGTFCRVLSWYDNEWGFSNRMLDTAIAFHRA